MATATGGLETIQEIEKEIEDLQQQAEAAREIVAIADTAIAEKYAQMRDAADALSGDFQLNGKSPAKAPAATGKKRGRPKGSKNVAVKKKRGRPKGSKNIAVKKKVKRAKKKAKPSKDADPMVKACFAILSDRRKWKKYNPDLPTGTEGLSVVELRKAIKGNELWPDDVATTVLSDTVSKLKEAGKVELLDGRRYKLIK